MKKYLRHIIETRTPHERRQWALSAAGVVTALVFVSWVGASSNSWSGAVDSTSAGLDSVGAAAASAAAALSQDPRLEVATSSVYAQ